MYIKYLINCLIFQLLLISNTSAQTIEIKQAGSSTALVNGSTTLFPTVNPEAGESVERRYEIYNSGTGALAITQVSVTNEPKFTIRQGITMVSPTHYYFTVVYKPSGYSTGNVDSSELTILSNDLAHPSVTINLQGVSGGAGHPALTVVASYNYVEPAKELIENNAPATFSGNKTNVGSVDKNGEEKTIIYHIRNHSGYNYGNISITLTNPTNFRFEGDTLGSTTPLIGTLGPYDFVFFVVKANPATFGALSTKVEIRQQGLTPLLFTIPLDLVGSQSEIEVKSVGLSANIADGDTTPVTTDGTQTGTVIGDPCYFEFQITNAALPTSPAPGPHGPLTVYAATLSGTDPTEFSILTPLPLVIPPLESRTIKVSYNTLDENTAKTATLNLSSYDPNEALFNFNIKVVPRNAGAPLLTGSSGGSNWLSNQYLVGTGYRTSLFSHSFSAFFLAPGNRAFTNAGRSPTWYDDGGWSVANTESLYQTDNNPFPPEPLLPGSMSSGAWGGLYARNGYVYFGAIDFIEGPDGYGDGDVYNYNDWLGLGVMQAFGENGSYPGQFRSSSAAPVRLSVPGPGLITAYCFRETSDGKVLAAGTTHGAPGMLEPAIGAFDSNGSFDGELPSLAANGSIYAMEILPDGDILVGGSFTSILGQSRSYLARLNSDGTLDSHSGLGVDALAPDGVVYAIEYSPYGSIYLTGSFTKIGASNRDGIAKINEIVASGEYLYVTLSSAPNFDLLSGSIVSSMVLQADGKLIFGGDFVSIKETTTSATTYTRKGLARLQKNGTLDPFFRTDFTVSTTSDPVMVTGVSLDQNGRIIVSGNFKKVASTLPTMTAAPPANATWNTAGSADGFAVLENNAAFIGTISDAGGQGPQAEQPSIRLVTRGAAPMLHLVRFETHDGVSIGRGTSSKPVIDSEGTWREFVDFPMDGEPIRAVGKTRGGYYNFSEGLLRFNVVNPYATP